MRGVFHLQLAEEAGDPNAARHRVSSEGTMDVVTRLTRASSLPAALDHSLRVRQDHPAFVRQGAFYSYRWLAEAIDAVRAMLESQPAFRPGACVALLCENSPAYVAAFYGVLCAGGVVAPMPPDVEDERLGTVLNRCNIDVVLSGRGLQPRLLQRLGAPAGQIPVGPRQSGRTEDVPPEILRGVTLKRDDLAAVLLTAGSTGEPKLVMLSHGNLLSNAASIVECLKIDPSDRSLALLPFCHSFGNSVLQTHLLAGATLVQAGSIVFPNSIVDAIRSHAATSLSGVPEVYRMLLARSDLGRTPLPSLRYLAAAGGALVPRLAEELAARIVPADLYLMYGQTEAAARLSCLAPEEVRRRPGSIGRGIPGVEIQVVDGSDNLVRPGGVGEVRARGANIMKGYLGDDEATARAIRNGWLYTGDLATIDEDGYLYLRGRAGDLVKISGYRVHPTEVENLVARRLAVQNVVVVPCETSLMGTRLALFVQPMSGQELAVDDVISMCQEELPRHKVPVHVEILAQMPLNGALKIDRPSLVRRATQSLAENA